jgi:hypothetical protein
MAGKLEGLAAGSPVSQPNVHGSIGRTNSPSRDSFDSSRGETGSGGSRSSGRAGRSKPSGSVHSK